MPRRLRPRPTLANAGRVPALGPALAGTSVAQPSIIFATTG